MFYGEKKVKTREWSKLILFYFKIGLLGHTLEQINKKKYWCVVIPLGSHSVYT